MNRKHFPDSHYLRMLATQAGNLMRRNLRLGMERTLKPDQSPVTETDTDVNRLVVESISRDYPHIQVLAEEGDYNASGAEYTVFCDPLDGTFPFSWGIPLSTFVASVVREHQPLSAVIYDPFMDRMWHAEHGRGAYLNNFPTHASRHSTIAQSRLCLIWPGSAPFDLPALATRCFQEGIVWSNPLTVAYYGGLLASGEQECSFFPARSGWETPAMQLIAEEAGGKATDMYGNPLRYSLTGQIEGHIITNGRLHEAFVKLIGEYRF